MPKTTLDDNLCVAAANGDIATCEALIGRGASVVNADEDGWTALHSAVSGGHPDVCALIVNHGADWRAKAEVIFRRLTPMQQAVFSGRTAIVDYFVLKHAEGLDQLTDDGQTLDELAGAIPNNGEMLLHLMRLRSNALLNGIEAVIDNEVGITEASVTQRMRAPSL